MWLVTEGKSIGDKVRVNGGLISASQSMVPRLVASRPIGTR